jgi:hypothetical protein
MNQREAKEYGIDQGYSAVQYCDVSDIDQSEANCECLETGKGACKDCLTYGAFESEQNARQYSPFEFFAHEINSTGDRAEGLWEAYDQGVAIGIKRGLKDRLSEFANDDDDDQDASCDQCQALMINGVYCHETGCPNTRKIKVDGEWISPESEDYDDD